VLGLLYGNPARSFYSNEIVRLSGVGIGTVHRELARLHASGLVTAGLIGNQKHYQANREAPVFDELRGLAVKTFGVADVLRSALAPSPRASASHSCTVRCLQARTAPTRRWT
jgi:hypothetical protein